jgi:hypothetical protein
MTACLNFREVVDIVKRKNLVCTSIDDNYLWPWMVMVYSAAINSQDKDFRIIIANINGMLSNELITISKKFTLTRTTY